jgi:hypothetical protein
MKVPLASESQDEEVDGAGTVRPDLGFNNIESMIYQMCIHMKNLRYYFVKSLVVVSNFT